MISSLWKPLLPRFSSFPVQTHNEERNDLFQSDCGSRNSGTAQLTHQPLEAGTDLEVGPTVINLEEQVVWKCWRSRKLCKSPKATKIQTRDCDGDILKAQMQLRKGLCAIRADMPHAGGHCWQCGVTFHLVPKQSSQWCNNADFNAHGFDSNTQGFNVTLREFLTAHHNFDA